MLSPYDVVNRYWNNKPFFTRRKDRGAVLENLVYMHLRRHDWKPEYHVTESGGEVDFVFMKPRGERQLIQVCWDVNDPRTRERAVGALLDAMDELSVERGTMVSWMDETSPDSRIDTLPAWRWLLADP